MTFFFLNWFDNSFMTIRYILKTFLNLAPAFLSTSSFYCFLPWLVFSQTLQFPKHVHATKIWKYYLLCLKLRLLLFCLMHYFILPDLVQIYCDLWFPFLPLPKKNGSPSLWCVPGGTFIALCPNFHFGTEHKSCNYSSQLNSAWGRNTQCFIYHQ